MNIDDNLFDSVSVGVNIIDNANASVTRNNFIIGHGNGVTDVSSKTFSGCYQNIGILVQNTPQFVMEQNDFQGIPNTTLANWYNFGTVVANTGAVTNHVYRNTFDSLTYGVYSVGCNTDGLPISGLTYNGLLITCDNFSNNNTDIMVSAGDTGRAPQGINSEQAGVGVPAMNTFSGSTMNIANYCTYFIYSYDIYLTTTEYPYHLLTYGTTISTSGRYYNESCASTLPPLPGSIVYNGSTATYGQPEIVLNSHKQLFLSNRAIFVNTLNQYNNLMDFGSTANLISRIDTSTNDTTLYNYLMQGVPYLSAK
jgi:hypothetical protein